MQNLEGSFDHAVWESTTFSPLLYGQWCDPFLDLEIVYRLKFDDRTHPLAQESYFDNLQPLAKTLSPCSLALAKIGASADFANCVVLTLGCLAFNQF